MWLLIVTWMHFSTPNVVIEFNTQETCEVARKVIMDDVEKARLRLEANMKKDNPTMTYNSHATSYCFKK